MFVKATGVVITTRKLKNPALKCQEAGARRANSQRDNLSGISKTMASQPIAKAALKTKRNTTATITDAHQEDHEVAAEDDDGEEKCTI